MSDRLIAIAAESKLEWSEIEAAEPDAPKIPTFSMLAYTGGPMRVAGFADPIVVDLAGVTSADAVPIFRGHDPDKEVGHGSVTVSADDIRVSGVISGANEHSQRIVASGKNGFPWQASIGGAPEKVEFVKRGEKVVVNGKTRQGPINVVRKMSLNEVSVVPLGADRKTKTSVAAESVTLSELCHRRQSDKQSVTLSELQTRSMS